MGVAVFFLLSGYLLVSRWKETDKMLLFVCKRAVRLYPSYWVSVIITFVVCKFLLPTRAVSFADGLINLTMLQSFFGVESVDGAYWTLSKEIVFYAIIALLILLKQKKQFPYFSLAWMAILFLSYFLTPYSKIFNIINLVLISGYAQMFLIGANIYFVFAGNKHQIGISVVVVVLSIVYQCLVHDVGYMVFLLIALILLMSSIVLNKKELDNLQKVKNISKPAIFISAISYQIYLIHQNIGYAILQIFDNYGIVDQWLIIVPILVCVVIAYCIYRFVEVPVGKAFKRLEGKKRASNEE